MSWKQLRGTWVVLFFVAACGRSTVTVGASPSNASPSPKPPAPNNPLIVNANGPYRGTVGVPIAFAASVADPGASTLNYQWDFGDGSTSTSASPSHSYLSAGDHKVTVTVTDWAGRTATATTMAQVTSATAGVTVSVSPSTTTITAGASASFTATVSGASNTQVTWAASGGSISGTGATVNYTAPNASGTYSLTATSVADSTKSATATIAVTTAGGGGPDFPASSIIYQDISGAALDPKSSEIINHLNSAGGWGTSQFQIDFGLTILYADATVIPRAFTPASDYLSPDCDMTAVPVPPGGSMEASSDYSCDTSSNDCHMLVYQGSRLYELYHANIADGTATGGPFSTSCEVVWDLTRDYWQAGTPYSRGDQCTSADAAGMPIAPLLVTGTELQSGIIRHALRFTLPNSRIRAGVYLHPGTHAGGPRGGSLMPAYTSRFRLRADFDISSLPNAAAQAIGRALQKYGMFLDDGGNVPLTIDQSAASYIGSRDLQGLKVTDFEIVASPDAPIPLTYNCQRTPVTQ